MTDKKLIAEAIIELTRYMKLAAEREEYESAIAMKLTISLLRRETVRSFEESEIAELQSAVHKITGNGEVMQLFNKMLGVSAG